MNQPDDKSLHDWVRQALADYRPADEPTDWVRLQRRLRNQRRRRGGLLLGAALLMLGIVGWLWQTGDTSSRATRPEQSFIVTAPHRSVPAPVPLGMVAPSGQPVRREIRGGENRAYRNKRSDPDLQHRQLLDIQPIAPASLPGNALSADLTRRYKTLPWSREETAIVEQVTSGYFGADSTSYRVLERNLTRWPDAVIVCDMTSSMYPYSTQVVSWLRRQASKPGLLGLVFFTDCDSLGRQTRPGGAPGQMYVVPNPQPETLLAPLLAAARNTVRNKDDAENDIEALTVAQQTFPQARHLILVADNLSRVKDIARLATINRPVHVILCGTTGGTLIRPFQPDFEQIAKKTQGSLHTLEDDLDLVAISGHETLHVGQYYYRYNKHRQQFQLTEFRHRPRRWLGFIWL